MAYIDQHQDPRRRAVAIAGVAAVHAAIGAGLLIGLTVRGYIPAPEIYDPTTFTTPPKPAPPPPQADQPDVVNDRVVVPPLPPIDFYPDDPIDRVEVTDTPIDPAGDLGTDFNFPPPKPTVAPGFTPKGAVPRNNTASWIDNKDYPASALRNEVEGTVGYRLVISCKGEVSACDITRSSGNTQLDDAACSVIKRRA